MEDKFLQTAVQQLVAHHTDFKCLLKEVELEEHHSKEKDGTNKVQYQSLTVESIMNSVKQHLRLSSSNPATDAAIFISLKVKELLYNRNSSVLLSHPSPKNQVLALIEVAKCLFNEGSLNRQQFTTHITAETMLPLEVIWMFHSEDIMSLDEFITCNLSRPKVIGKLAHDIPEICSAIDFDFDYRRKIINDIMKFLINQAYVEPIDSDNPTSRGMKKVSGALLDSITKKILQHDNEKDVSIFVCLLDLTEHYQIDCIKKFCTRQITLILNFNPHFKVSDALMHQSKWSFAKTDPYRTQMYRELLLQLSAKEAIRILQVVLEEQEVNWEAVLSFAASLLLCYSDAPNLIQVLSIELITGALEKSELDGLIVGFLLARQAALEGQHVFQSYQQWFYTTFGEQNTSPASNKKSFAFLIKFLSDIVPYESVQHLKAHIWRQPYVPPKCRPLLSDYVSLVKTRLMDLGEPLDEISIFSEGSGVYHSGSNAGDGVMIQARNDVDKAINNFERSWKIPASIMEASIFRKPYFVGSFLPALLTPRPLPDKPDTRMVFIEALYKTDKIPQTLYTSYVDACEKISKQLLEGVFFEADDKCMEDLLLSPWEQYEKSLATVQQHIERMLSNTVLKKATSYESVLSVLYEKMCVFLNIEDTSIVTKIENNLLVDITCPSLCKAYLKVIDSLLSAVTTVLNKVTSSNYTWLTQLLKCVCRNKDIHKTLCVRLWYLICVEATQLNDFQIRCIASLCVVLFRSTNIGGISIKLDETETRPFHEAVLLKINVATKCWMIFTLKYLTYYMEPIFTYSVEENVLTLMQEFANIFSFLVTRIKFSEQFPESHFVKAAWSIYTSKNFQQCGFKQINIESWIDLELKVDATDDILDDAHRHKYYNMMIFTEFLPRHDQVQKNVWADYFCTKIALSLINHQAKHFNMTNCLQITSHQGKHKHFCRFHLVNLLQHLTQYLSSHQQGDHPWLVQLYKDVHENFENWSELDNVINLGSQLSPYLLLVNTLQPCVPCSSLNGTVHIINTVFKEVETQGPVLSYPTTLYIIQALLSTQHLQIDWKELFRSCPLIPASVQYHWSRLEDCVNNIMWKEPVRSLVKEIDSIHTMLKRYASGKESEPSYIYQCDHLLLALAILSYLQTSTNSANICDILIKIPELCSNFTTSALSQLSWSSVHNQSISKEIKDVVVSVFIKSPESFNSVENITQRMCSTASVKFRSPAFLKLMQEVNTHDMKQVLSVSSCVKILLQEYTKCVQIYEMGTETNKPISRISSLVQPLTLSFLQDCGMWIKENLKHISPSIMKQNVAALEKCDSHIRNLIW